MMRIRAMPLAVLLLCCLAAVRAEEPADWFRIENGMAQPVVAYTDAQRADYTNEGSAILRFAVYVETDFDTDLDGKPDLIKVVAQVPRAAAEGRCRVPAIYEARPYIAGVYGYSPELPPVGVSGFDADALRTKPEKRIPAGGMSTLALAAQADPADWYYQLPGDPFGQQYLGNLTAYDYYLVRGFAVVQAAGLGTWGSEGVECCTDELEADAFRCVVEWLTGDRPAYTDRVRNLCVRADWCSGSVGMTGRSYAGAMAFEVAASGVKGLKTVVPVAGPASWYEYGNAQGAPNGLFQGCDFISGLAAMCASRFMGETDPALTDRYERFLARLRDEQIALAGDYGPFWAARDWSARTGFRASALIVQGLNDENVRPKQADLMRNAFLASGCEVKCILHRNGHVTPAGEQTMTDILIGEHTYTEWLNLWFTHWLLGVENEAARLPALTVQSNVDGTFFGAEEWRGRRLLRMDPGRTDEYMVSAENAHPYNPSLLEQTFDGASGPDRLLWRMEVSETLTLAGPAEVHLRVRTPDTDKPLLMLGAVLVDQAEEPYPCFCVNSAGVLEQQVIRKNGLDRGEGTAPYDLVVWEQTERNRSIVTYGTMDLHNPASGYAPASAVRAEEPPEAERWYDYTLYLQPTYYTVPAGHRLELYIVPFCGFSDDLIPACAFTAEELSGMGIDPDTLAPFTRDYRFTVDCGASYALLPAAEVPERKLQP